MNTTYSIPLLILFFLLTQSSLLPKEITITEVNNTKSVMLQPEDTLRVDLVGNPTTGYTWEVISDGSPQLASLGTNYSQASTLCGAGGTFTFYFKAIAEGTSHLKLIYDRPWEKDTAPSNTFDVNVIIQPKKAQDND